MAMVTYSIRNHTIKIEIDDVRALLDAARLALDLTSDGELAKRVGVSRQTVQGWRHGRTAMSAEHMRRVWRVFPGRTSG